MADIKELAISYWRMDKWLNNANVERKMAASSALRSIKKYLDANGVEVVDLTGQKFDSGLAVDVINNDIPEGSDDSNALISEMIKPIIMQNGSVIQFGQVSIGLTVKKQIENNPAKEEQSQKQHVNDLWIKEEIANLKALIGDKPSKKAKIAIFIFSVALVVLLLTNIVMISLYKHDLSRDIANSNTYSNSEDITAAKESIGTIEKAIGKNSDKLDELFKKYNNSLKNEVKLQNYTVQKGDNLYTICESKGIDFNKSIKLIQSINGLDDPSKIYVGQTIVLPITDTEE